MLCCVGILYYVTEGRRQPVTTASLYGYAPPAPQPDPSNAFWHHLNPEGWPTILATVPEPHILILPRAGHAVTPTALRQLASAKKWVRPRIRPLLFILKVTVLPPALTAGLLYALLLYLLKDADLLDAQRNKLGLEEPEDVIRPVVRMLPAPRPADIDVLRASRNGIVAVSITDGEVALWRFDNNTRTVVPGEAIDVAVNHDGTYLAIATLEQVCVWTTNPLKLIDTVPTSTRGIAFASNDDPFQTRPTLLIARADGVLALDDTGQRLVMSHPDIRLVVGHTTIAVSPSALWTQQSTGWTRTELHSTGGVIATTSLLQLDKGDWGSILAIGWRSGLIEVFDMTGHLLVGTHHDRPREINIRAGKSRCGSCGISQDGFDLVISTASTTYVDRVHPSVICRCHPRLAVPPRRTPLGSPLKSPTLLPTGEFPLSSHGTRRLSTLNSRDDMPDSWTDLEITPVGQIPSLHGGAGVIGNTLIGLNKSGMGVDDDQWEIFTVDLTLWDAGQLVVHTTTMEVESSVQSSTSIHDQRTERISSLSGRKSFPSISAAGRGMAYVRVDPLVGAGERLLGGFGDRLGVITLEKV